MTKLKAILTKVTAIAVASAFVLPALFTSPAKAFPDGPIAFIIPFGAGGGADIEGRLLAKEMSKVLGVPVVPINKTGGGGAVAYTYTKNSDANGQTVVWNSLSILTTTNIGNVPFDYSALDHVGQVEYQPMPLVVSAKSKHKTLKSFMDACKAAPGKLKMAFAGFGSGTHLFGLAMMNEAGCKPALLPVKAPKRNAVLLSGEADIASHIFTNPVKLVKAGKLRFLVISSGKRSPQAPDVPTATELGYNVNLDLFRGLSVPKGTPAATIAKLADAMTKAANSKAFQDFGKKKGFTIETLGPKAFDKKLAGGDKIVKKARKPAGIYRSKTKK